MGAPKGQARGPHPAGLCPDCGVRVRLRLADGKVCRHVPGRPMASSTKHPCSGTGQWPDQRARTRPTAAELVAARLADLAEPPDPGPMMAYRTATQVHAVATVWDDDGTPLPMPATACGACTDRLRPVGGSFAELLAAGGPCCQHCQRAVLGQHPEPVAADPARRPLTTGMWR